MKCAVLVVVAMTGCGPSAAEIRSPRNATYAMDARHLMQVAMAAAHDLYGVGAIDLPKFRFVTQLAFTAGTARELGRGGFLVEVHATDAAHSYVLITEVAQQTLSIRGAPSWVDVPPDNVGLGAALDRGADRLALAIDQLASRRPELTKP